MRRGDLVYRFGPFELHPTRGRLLRDGRPVVLRDAAFAVLVHLVAHAPGVEDRDAIARAGWRGTASAGSVEQAISRLRKALGEAHGSAFIETVPNRGYRFTAAVEEVDAADTPGAGSLEAGALRAFVTGQRELATLNRNTIAEARRRFERMVEEQPDYAPAHVKLSTACALAYEASRFDDPCDPGA